MTLYSITQPLKVDRWKWALLTALVVFVSACNDSKTSATGGEVSPAAVVLATVNGKEITEDDVDFMIERTFSNADQLFIDAAIKDKVLQSLIAASAMRHAMETTLSADDLEVIRRKTNAFEEELFLKAYLVESAVPNPVTTAMVTDYYDRYPEQFGGITVKTFEQLSISGKPSDTQRDAFLGSIGALKKDKSWQVFADKKQALSLVYKKAKLQPGLFDKRLEAALKNMQPGEVSDVVFINKVPTLARVIAVDVLSPKPLHEVSAGIRKKLAPLQLKKAVKAASEKAVKNAEVVIK